MFRIGVLGLVLLAAAGAQAAGPWYVATNGAGSQKWPNLRFGDSSLKATTDFEIQKGIYHYRVYIPVGYYENKATYSPCLFIASPGGNAGMGHVAQLSAFWPACYSSPMSCGVSEARKR